MSERKHPDDHGPGEYHAHELTYNEYLHIPTLLGLQKRLSDPPCHDEHLFIIIHQTYELWFRQMLHDLEAALPAIDQDQHLQAHHFVNRVVEILRVLVGQVHILETMAPAEFLEFRDRLNPASGFQSLQFRELEFFAGLKDERYLKPFKNKPEYLTVLKQRLQDRDLRQALHDMLLRSTDSGDHAAIELPPEVEADKPRAQALRSLITIYENPHNLLPIYLLCESLLEFDEFLTKWRHHHVLMVERVIGYRPGTGGSGGVRYLEKTTAKRCFPLLWEVRTYLRKPKEFWTKPDN